MNRSWVAVLFLVLATACGGGSTETPATGDETTGGEAARGPQWDDPLALVPDSFPVIVRVDVARLRSSPYYDRLLPMVAEQIGDGERLVELLGQSSMLAGGFEADANGDVARTVVALRGSFQAGGLEQLVRRFAGEAQDPVAERTVRDQRVLVVRDGSFFDTSAGTWLIGDHADLDGAVELGYTPGASMRTTTRHRDLSQRIQLESGTATAVGEMPELVRARLRRDADPFVREHADAVTRGAGFLDMQRGLNARVDLEATTPQAANEIAQYLRSRLSEASSDMTLNLMGVASYLRQIQVGVEGPHVMVSVQLSHEDTERLIGMAGLLFQ